jgi:hypothetical protein
MITNILPLPVVSAIVAHFDSNLNELRFGHNIVNIMIDNNATLYNDGSWVVGATHVSGIDLIVRVSAKLEVTFDEVCPHCNNTGWINHGYACGMICACQGDNIPEEQ